MTIKHKIFSFLIINALILSISSFCDAKITKNQMIKITQDHFSSQNSDTSDNILFQEHSIASLRFAWNTPVGAAAFERNGKIWLAFDHLHNIDIETLKKESKGLVEEIYTLPHPSGTIIIIHPKQNIKYSLRKEGLLWIMDLYKSDLLHTETQDMVIYNQFDSLKNSYLFIPSNHIGNIISIIDPELGDILSIFTTPKLGLGYSTFYRYPDFDILKTIQGFAIVINAPDIALNRGNSGITIKALGRSLNISNELEFLKQQQLLNDDQKDSAYKSAFNLNIPQKLANQKIIDVIEDFKKQILAAPQEEKNSLRIQLAQYYVYNGLGYEALYILNQLDKLKLPETQNDYFHALTGIANFLARRWKEATKHFSYGNIPNTTEGIFWRTIAKSAYQFEEGNNAIILTHISIMKDYPQIIKDAIAIIATKNAIAANDDLSAQNFIDILKSVNFRFNRIEPQISYLLGQKLEMQGYLRNAIREYQTLLNSNLTMFSAYGRLRHTILNQMVNFIDTKKAISELEKLRFAWGEREFQIKLLSKLADFYLKDKDYYNALRILNEEGFIVDNDKKINISQKMIKIFEDVFIGNHADEILSPIKTLSLFEDFSWLVDLSVHRNTILQKLADRLVAIDLLPRAKNILLDLTLRDDLTPDDMGRIGARLAVIYLFEKIPEQAIDILDATASPQTSSEIMALRRIVRSQALSALGKPEEALALLKDDFSINALLYKFQIYWKAQDWHNASNTIKYLISEPIKGEPLSKEQMNYILDWATTLKKAGKETVLVRLRNKFMPYFKNTSHQSVFDVLTNRLEKDEVNINQIRSVINEVQNFNEFAKFYTNSLKEESEKQSK